MSQVKLSEEEQKLVEKQLSNDKVQFLSDCYVEFWKQRIFDDPTFRSNFGLVAPHTAWRQYLLIYEYYKMVHNITGSIIEFGCRCGQNLTTLSNFRGLMEPHSLTRKIVGFDTFEGFPSLHEKDKNKFNSDLADVVEGAYNTNLSNMDQFLYQCMEGFSAAFGLSADRSFDLVKGDALETIPTYFKENVCPVALAIFDFDLYEPTKVALEAVWPRLSKGSVLVFDQYGYEKWPGETLAVREFFADKEMPRIQRITHLSQMSSYLVIE